MKKYRYAQHTGFYARYEQIREDVKNPGEVTKILTL